MVAQLNVRTVVLALLFLQEHVQAVQFVSDLRLRLNDSHPTSTLRAYASDCGKRREFSFFQESKLPGAGMNPQSIVPYDVVLKDGYIHVGCVKDKMFEVGDKFGNNKFSYKLGKTANVSIIHYAEMVPDEDKQPITHSECFKFCRTVPLMSFFGITHGRDCYCTPFFHEIAGDSSDCDSVCDGDSGSLCGGKTKSSMFSMHNCADTALELTAVSETGESLSKNTSQLAKDTKTLAQDMEKVANDAQSMFEKAGDPAASKVLQSTKVFSGKLLHTAEDALEVAKDIDKGTKDAEGMKKNDFTSNAKVTAAEKVIAGLEEDIAEIKNKSVTLKSLYGLATRGKGKDHEGHLDQYYPLMYFVDKTHEDVPTTCGGEVDKQSIFAASKDECAAACNSEVQTCVGFSFYEGGVCLLVSKFKSVTYYTKCGDKAKDKAKTACYAKLKYFEGVILKPDGSGKCDACLKEATEAKRCF